MLTELCAELKNYFLRNQSKDIHNGLFTISGGSIDLPFLLDGQYFRIVGSVMNDGVYQYPVSELADETFSGAIWAMAVPPAVIALAAEIDEWNEANAKALASPYQSENFEVYGRTMKSGRDGNAYTWRDHFDGRLRKFRRFHVL